MPILKDAIGHYWALMIMVPGLYGLSAIIWGFLFVKMKCQDKQSDQTDDQSAEEGVTNQNFDDNIAVL